MLGMGICEKVIFNDNANHFRYLTGKASEESISNEI